MTSCHLAIWAALSATLVVVALGQPLAGYVFDVDGVLIGADDEVWLAKAMAATLVLYLPLAIWVDRAGGDPTAHGAPRAVTSSRRRSRRHVGYRWRKASADRLYGWRADPNLGAVELGHVDLATGRTHPVHREPLGKDLDLPEKYLARLRDHFPAAS